MTPEENLAAENIDKIIGMSLDEFEKLTEQQLLTYLAPCLKVIPAANPKAIKRNIRKIVSLTPQSKAGQATLKRGKIEKKMAEAAQLAAELGMDMEI